MCQVIKYLIERRRTAIAKASIAHLLADRDKQSVIICQLRETVFHQQKAIEMLNQDDESDQADRWKQGLN